MRGADLGLIRAAEHKEEGVDELRQVRLPTLRVEHHLCVRRMGRGKQSVGGMDGAERAVALVVIRGWTHTSLYLSISHTHAHR